MTASAPNPAPAPQELRALAHTCADRAKEILKQNFRQKIAVHDKEDGSIVTPLDIQIEKELRALISENAPACGIMGEELPPHNDTAPWCFVIDPLDGTLAYINGKPLYGVLIAILHDGVPVYGIIEHPQLDERWHGGVGHPCQHNESLAHANTNAQLLKDATLNATSPHMFTPPHDKQFHKLARATKTTLYGSDCYAYGMLASGATELIAEASMKKPDFLALAPVVLSAGGAISDWKGRLLNARSDGTVLASASQALHAEALAVLAS